MGKAKILLVDDSLGDATLLKEALRLAEFDGIVDHVLDGAEALKYLHLGVEVDGNSKTSLIFMDVNMPRMNGIEALAEIRSHRHFQHIPVVMLTTSNSMDDMNFCYSLGANAFLTKQTDFDEFCSMIRGMLHFWTAIVIEGDHQGYCPL